VSDKQNAQFDLLPRSANRSVMAFEKKHFDRGHGRTNGKEGQRFRWISHRCDPLVPAIQSGEVAAAFRSETLEVYGALDSPGGWEFSAPFSADELMTCG
jgi:hypothetical protein